MEHSVLMLFGGIYISNAFCLLYKCKYVSCKLSHAWPANHAFKMHLKCCTNLSNYAKFFWKNFTETYYTAATLSNNYCRLYGNILFLVFLKNVFHIRDMKGTWILVGACSVIYCRGKRKIDCVEKLMYLALRLNKVISLRLFLYVDHLSHATEWDSFKWQHIVLQFYILETMQICVAYLAAKHDWPDLTASLVASFDLKQSM